ncbi:capsule assembly Wzi family protein [Paraglaciecola aquimarina]|uniref:Capsule assembly Wzi family protein n=1 Tax=Paraglaciecola algarum TaxID=3050085 RepID=A0ABS9D621_9ALTE|nr:capsule assembly Wzi family protein [Paraglaciecola sp. G1-23]MCF2947274.1 capsule assembly Wzi family protein [Paraglaciecola sp. G1-23]
MLKSFLICILSIGISWSNQSISSPWIGTLEPQLHKDLQTLSEWGVIDAAVTSFPVPWKGIAQQLEKVNAEQLPAIPFTAAKRLKHYLQVHKTQKGQSIISLYGASDDSRFTDFSGLQAQKVQFNITKEFYLGRWAGQVSANYERGGKKHFDESFIAYQFGDWNLRLGSMSQWWGPAQSGSLILTNNARPIPSLALSRSEAIRSEHYLLKHLGPWFFTMQVGQLESERAVPDTKIWSTRFNFKPISGLEIGLSWNAMWGGKGRGNSLSDFINVITFDTECLNGQESCVETFESPIGNHHAGIDFIYTSQLFDRPISFYGQRIGEDKQEYFNVTDNANLFGISSYFWGSKVYLESSDTNVACSNQGLPSNNCYYEHGTYTSGYRFYNRAIGSTFDSDAKTLTLGINKQYSDGDLFEVMINHLELNQDKQSPSPVLQGISEDLLRLSGFYQTQFGDWLLKVGGNIEHGDISNDSDINAKSETNSLIYTEIKYRLH